MRKLKLNLDTLSVDTFAAGQAPSAAGTVQGQDESIGDYTNTWQCRKTVLTYCPCTPVWEPAAQPE